MLRFWWCVMPSPLTPTGGVSNLRVVCREPMRTEDRVSRAHCGDMKAPSAYPGRHVHVRARRGDTKTAKRPRPATPRRARCAGLKKARYGVPAPRTPPCGLLGRGQFVRSTATFSRPRHPLMRSDRQEKGQCVRPKPVATILDLRRSVLPSPTPSKWHSASAIPGSRQSKRVRLRCHIAVGGWLACLVSPGTAGCLSCTPCLSRPSE